MGHSYTAALRFSGPPEKIHGLSENLGLPGVALPQRVVNTASSMPVSILTWNYSISSSSPNGDWDSLEEALEVLLSECRSARHRIIAAASTLKGVWWCGHFQSSFDGGPRLTADLLEVLSSFTLPFYLDCYHGDDDDPGK